MPRPRKKTPSYRLHRSTGQAVVTLRNPRTGHCRDFYLGKHDTPESHVAYAELIKEFHESGGAVDGRPQPLKTVPTTETMTSLFVDYWKAQRRRAGLKERQRLKSNMYTPRVALRTCREYCGTMSVEEFGPLRLQQVREAFIDEGHNRDTINTKVATIVDAFRWGVSQERVPWEVLKRLETVEPLKPGEADVPERGKVEPVALDRVEAVRPWVSHQIRAMIDVQRYTGARPGEVVQMRPMDIDRSREVWVYTPQSHKTAYRGHRRMILLGPKAKAVLEPFLEGRAEAAYMFSPAEAERARREQQRARRTAHPSTNKSRDAKRKAEGRTAGANVGDHYTTDSYRRAIQRGCDRAFPPPKPLKGDKLKQWRKEHRWAPNQLRHTAATQIRRTHGLEAASLLLGHSSATITDAVYAERDLAKIEQAVLETG